MAKVKTIKSKFNPEGSYQWEPDDEFVLTGQQFSFLFNTFREMALGRGSLPAHIFMDGNEMLLSILKEGFDQGVVKEYVPEQDQGNVVLVDSKTK